MKSLQSRSATALPTAFKLKAFGVLAIATTLWTLSSAPKAQGLDRAAGSAAGIAANVALQASPDNKTGRFANRLLVEDPNVLAAVATRAINNIRSKLDSCGDNGMLALPEERARSASAVKVSMADIAARPALVFNPRLADAALKHSRSMAELSFFDHTDPSGKTVGARSKESGYRYRVVGENIAAGHDSVEDAVRGWLLSASHCENMIDPRFVEFGLAKVTSTNPSDPYGSYWTLVLGQPRTDQTASR
jgi:Cysteine-rich secretory protein family